jgi:hypothetical protein
MEKVAQTLLCSLLSIIKVTKPRGSEEIQWHGIDDRRVKFTLEQTARSKWGVQFYSFFNLGARSGWVLQNLKMITLESSLSCGAIR